jgi:hypothetical protein
MKASLLCIYFTLIAVVCVAQADNEIQVYASPTIGNKRTIVELHSNYTFRGSKFLANRKLANYTHETLEITHGFANDFEIGFYTFTTFSPDGKFQYLGNQIRPRVTVPSKWKWPFGTSLSVEFGFFRPDADSNFFWQGEIRPIIDKTIGNWYFAFNPNMDFIVSGNNKQVGLAPQFKSVYTIAGKLGVGFEYYSSLGTFTKIDALNMQEHLIGPMIDVYTDPKWELNFGALFGITPNSNQSIIKLLVGRRFGK